MEGEHGVSRSIIDELQSLDIQGDEREGKEVLPEILLMKFILGISKEIK